MLIVDDEPGLTKTLSLGLRAEGCVVAKADILRNVRDAHYDGPHNVVEVYVRYVRLKIDAPFGTNSIHTVRGVGYRLESEDRRTGS